VTILEDRPPAGTARATGRGRVRLTGLAIAAPGWQDQIETWCEVVGLDPPGGRGSTRRRPLSVSLVESVESGTAESGPIAWLLATTKDLDEALARCASLGAPVIAPPVVEAGGRVAVVKGPLGMPVRIMELAPQGRWAVLADTSPRRAEPYLRIATVANALIALALTGYFSHLALDHAPHHQASFAFLIGFCCVFAAAAVTGSWFNGMMSGEDAVGQGSAHPVRAEVAGIDQRDGSAGWRRWQGGIQAAAVAAVATALVLGLISAFILGRPLGFWTVWSWSASTAGTAMVLAGSLARRQGLLLAGRRAQALPVESVPAERLLRRVWLFGALPVALLSAAINTGEAWTAYRYGVSTKTLSSDLLSSVIVTAGVSYLFGRQFGRVDLAAGRLSIPESMKLPARVRLGAQGLVFGMVAELVLIYLAGHAIPHPPPLGVAVAVRTIVGLLAGAFGFGIGGVAGALNSAADREEGDL
jgi:hypothetical protein